MLGTCKGQAEVSNLVQGGYVLLSHLNEKLRLRIWVSLQDSNPGLPLEPVLWTALSPRLQWPGPPTGPLCQWGARAQTQPSVRRASRHWHRVLRPGLRPTPAPVHPQQLSWFSLPLFPELGGPVVAGDRDSTLSRVEGLEFHVSHLLVPCGLQ